MFVGHYGIGLEKGSRGLSDWHQYCFIGMHAIWKEMRNQSHHWIGPNCLNNELIDMGSDVMNDGIVLWHHSRESDVWTQWLHEE